MVQNGSDSVTWSTKIHLACERQRHVLVFLLTGGQAGDSPQMIPVLERIQVPRTGAAGPGPDPTECWVTRPTPRG